MAAGGKSSISSGPVYRHAVSALGLASTVTSRREHGSVQSTVTSRREHGSVHVLAAACPGEGPKLALEPERGAGVRDDRPLNLLYPEQPSFVPG